MKRMRTQFTNLEKIFKNTSDKGLLSKIYKKYLKHNKKKKKKKTQQKGSKKPNLQNGPKTLTDTSVYVKNIYK